MVWFNQFQRLLAILSVAILFLSQTAEASHSLGTVAIRALQEHRWYPGHYTQARVRPNLGANPRREPESRGLWNAHQLSVADRSAFTLFASLFPFSESAPPPSHITAVDSAAGGSHSWEGQSQSNGKGVASLVNTANGNKLTSVHLLSWKARGGMSVDFTLYHNSQTSYNDELGHGWTWTYDIYINDDDPNNPVVHWGDGLSIPYSYAGTLPTGVDFDYVQGAGIFDKLTKKANGTWQVTTHGQTVYQFNADGFCNKVQDRNGNHITLTLNGQNYVTKISDPTGREIDITLDSNNNFTSITDDLGRTWEFNRDASDDLVEVEFPPVNSVSYTESFTYNAAHDILSHTDKRGKVWATTYTTSGSVLTEKDPLNNTTTYAYTASATTITDPIGKVITHNYSSGLLVSEVDEAGFSVSKAYNSANLPTSITDKRGKVWSFTYDSRGNVLTRTSPLSKVHTLTYNSTNDVLTSTNPLSQVTTFTYDASGNMLTATDPLSRVTEFTYSSHGLVTNIENHVGEVTTFTYDTYGNMTSTTNPLGHVTSFSVSVLGWITGTTDATSLTTNYAYDNWGRLDTITYPGSATKVLTYNANSQPLTQTNERGKVTTLVYDDAGRLTSLTNAKGETENYSYNARGDRTSLTNGRGKVRTFSFTDRGEVASVTLPDASVEAWSYDGEGNSTAYTNPLGQVIYYTYDNAGRQTGVDYPAGTDTTFTYDDADRRTGMSDSTGTTTWTYNAAGEPTNLSAPQGSQTYTYDGAGRRKTMVEAHGATTYNYDTAGRLTSLVNAYGQTTTFAYDNANRMTKQTYSPGQYTETTYNSRGWVATVNTKKSDHTILGSETYTYDVGGNLTQKVSGSTTTTYAYDDIDQLITETRAGVPTSYTYDANGNRASRTTGGVTEVYTVDDADKLLHIKVGATTVKSYTYDTAGRTTAVTTSAGTTTLTYDYESRVSQITYPSTATNTFTYNGLDTRVGKVDSSGTHTFRRDGDTVTSPVLDDGFAKYTPGVSDRRGSSTRFTHPDRMGSVVRHTGSSQGVASARQYDAWGDVAAASGTWAGPFGYAGNWGYQDDSDSGLKLLGHRYYDASTGRFLTRDPIKDGRNWYAYCENNPLRAVDPEGLSGGRNLLLQILFILSTGFGPPGSSEFDLSFSGPTEKPGSTNSQGNPKPIQTGQGRPPTGGGPGTGPKPGGGLNFSSGSGPNQFGNKGLPAKPGRIPGPKFPRGRFLLVIQTMIDGADALFQGLWQVIKYRRRLEAYVDAAMDPENDRADGFERR
jgi:RHS repeat-associated protein